MLHLAILLEEGNLVDRRLNSQDQVEFIVHFDGNWPVLVLDARANPALIEAITHLTLVVAIEFTSKKSGNICGFDHIS